MEAGPPSVIRWSARPRPGRSSGMTTRIGAADHITQPSTPREVLARVRVLLRRAAVARPAEVIAVGDLEIASGRFEVRRAGRPVVLTNKEFAILEALATQPGRVFTRAEII